MRKIDLTGRVFGKLTVISMSTERMNKGSIKWICECDCGKVVNVVYYNLVYGNTRSCGCLTKHLSTTTEMNIHTHKDQAYIHRKYRNYKNKCKNKDWIFELTEKEFVRLSIGNCHYCGTPLKENIYKSTIDRLNNDRGYTIENCVPACFHCNAAKNSLSESEFLDMIKQIFVHRLLK